MAIYWNTKCVGRRGMITEEHRRASDQDDAGARPASCCSLKQTNALIQRQPCDHDRDERADKADGGCITERQPLHGCKSEANT